MSFWDPTLQKDSWRALEHNAVEGAKKSAPDAKRDRKFFIAVLSVLLLIGVCFGIGYFSIM